jgi:hypothetical protein
MDVLAERHRRRDDAARLLIGAAVVGFAIGLLQALAVDNWVSNADPGGPFTDLFQWVFLGSVTLLALEYTTGRLGVIWGNGHHDRDAGTDGLEDGDGEDESGAGRVIVVAVGVGLLGVWLDPLVTQFLVDVIAAGVGVHVALLYLSNRNGSPDGHPWSGLVVSQARYEGRNTYVQLRNVVGEPTDLSNAELEDGSGNRQPLPGEVVLDEDHRTELFLFDETEEFRPEAGEPLLLHVAGGTQTVPWEPPEE